MGTSPRMGTSHGALSGAGAVLGDLLRVPNTRMGTSWGHLHQNPRGPAGARPHGESPDEPKVQNQRHNSHLGPPLPISTVPYPTWLSPDVPPYLLLALLLQVELDLEGLPGFEEGFAVLAVGHVVGHGAHRDGAQVDGHVGQELQEKNKKKYKKKYYILEEDTNSRLGVSWWSRDMVIHWGDSLGTITMGLLCWRCPCGGPRRARSPRGMIPPR